MLISFSQISPILGETRCARDFVLSIVSFVVSNVVSFSQILPIVGRNEMCEIFRDVPKPQ